MRAGGIEEGGEISRILMFPHKSRKYNVGLIALNCHPRRWPFWYHPRLMTRCTPLRIVANAIASTAIDERRRKLVGTSIQIKKDRACDEHNWRGSPLLCRSAVMAATFPPNHLPNCQWRMLLQRPRRTQRWCRGHPSVAYPPHSCQTSGRWARLLTPQQQFRMTSAGFWNLRNLDLIVSLSHAISF